MSRGRARRAVGQRRDPRADRLPHAVRRVRREGRSPSRPGADPAQQLLLIGIVGAAAGVGSFAGNAAGSRAAVRPLRRGRAARASARAVAAAVLAAVLPGHRHRRGRRAGGGHGAARWPRSAWTRSSSATCPRSRARRRSGGRRRCCSWRGCSAARSGVLLPHDTYWLGFTVVAAWWRSPAADGAGQPGPHAAAARRRRRRGRAPTMPTGRPWRRPGLRRLSGCAAPAPRRWSPPRYWPAAAARRRRRRSRSRAGTRRVRAAPTQYCDIDLQNCTDAGTPAVTCRPGRARR